MRADDHPVLDKEITRLDLARMGRWPGCGAPFLGVHRGTCNVSVTQIKMPQEFVTQSAVLFCR